MMPLSGSVTQALVSGSTLGSAAFGLRPRLRLPVACSSASRASIFACWRAAAAAARRSSFSLHLRSRASRSARPASDFGKLAPCCAAGWLSSRASVASASARICAISASMPAIVRLTSSEALP
jgi:hypothetical protein